VAAPPLDLPCDRPVTCPGDSKILVKSSRWWWFCVIKTTLWNEVQRIPSEQCECEYSGNKLISRVDAKCMIKPT
jgi:hypothetical protein